MKLVMRKHAREQMALRGLEEAWVRKVALRPDWTEPDPQPGVSRHHGAVEGFGGRVLRVVVLVAAGGERHVLTAHFDRAATTARRRSS